MKYQIRQGVFETNSSSTHSLQISKGGVQEAKADIISNKFSIKQQKFESCINGDTLVVKGIKCETGGDESDVYTIITKWEAKLQYIASLLFGIYEDYEPEDIEHLKIIFTEYAIKVCEKHNVNITDVIYDKIFTNWPEYFYYPNDLEGLSKEFDSDEEIEEFINKVMEDDYTITFCSEAYSPYEGYTINII